MKTPESPLGGCERQRDSCRIIYNFLAWRGMASARSPGAASAREGSNDDLYPLLPVLLPTRDNTNHYHRLITGITANIEIMHACVYVSATDRANVYMCTSQAASRLIPSYRPAEGAAAPSFSPLFLPRHPHSLSLFLSFLSSLSFSPAAIRYSTTTLPASFAIRRVAASVR